MKNTRDLKLKWAIATKSFGIRLLKYSYDDLSRIERILQWVCYYCGNRTC